MQIEWRKGSDGISSVSPPGFFIGLTKWQDEFHYFATYTGQPHKPSIGTRIVTDPYDLDKKKAAISELKAACEDFLNQTTESRTGGTLPAGFHTG